MFFGDSGTKARRYLTDRPCIGDAGVLPEPLLARLDGGTNLGPFARVGFMVQPTRVNVDAYTPPPAALLPPAFPIPRPSNPGRSGSRRHWWPDPVLSSEFCPIGSMTEA